MKRICLQKNTTCPAFAGIEDQRKLNTDDQATYTFHPVDVSLQGRLFEPEGNQRVNSFFRMNFFLFLASVLFVFTGFSQDLVILHTNDMHSHLNGLAPETEYTPLVNDNDPTLGGFSRIAGFIGAEKVQHGNKLLVLDAGDFLMGTLYQSLEIEKGFQLNLMKKIGYDFVAIGNHEFDFGPNVLAQIIEKNKKLGDIPGILLANYVNAKDKSDADFVKLFDDKTIVPYTIIERNGYKIGVISVLGKDADESIAGYINVSFSDIKKTAGKIARKLKEKDQVDLVVVLSHSGVEKDKKGNWAGEDVELAKSSPSIDIVISGHTHTYLSEPLKVGNAIVVQTGSHGSNMGKVEVTFDANRKPSFAFRLVPMDDNVMADAAVQSLIDDKNPWIEENILQGAGVKLSQVLFETSFPLKLDEKKPEVSNLGPFVADAVYHFLNKKHSEEVDLTIVATGVIRHDIVTGNTGKQNINDLFNVMPLGVGEGLMPGSPLGKIYISGNELKKVFELILTVYPSMNSYYLFFSGLEITYNPKKGLFKKISEMKVGSPEKGYRKVSFSKKDDALYAIAANKYILSFIGAIRKMSFGIVNVVGKDINGKVIENDDFLIDLDKNTEGIQEAKEWLALLEYVRSFPDTNGNNIPDVPEKYRAKTNAVFVAK